jgi:hypothetical protein
VFLGALDIFNFFAFPIFSKIVKKSSNFKFHVCSVLFFSVICLQNKKSADIFTEYVFRYHSTQTEKHA